MGILFWLFLAAFIVFCPTLLLMLTAKKGKFIYLTFDDGPDPKITPLVLNTLKKYGIKATFFIIGQKAEKYPEIIKKIVADGHIIGNHSYSHKDYLGIYPPWKVSNEYSKTANAIQKITGVKSSLARLPQGVATIYSYMALVLNGYKLVNWSVSVNDWEEKTTKEEIIKKVLASSRTGSVILLHDSLNFKEGTQTKVSEALPEIIEGLQKRHFVFKNL